VPGDKFYLFMDLFKKKFKIYDNDENLIAHQSVSGKVYRPCISLKYSDTVVGLSFEKLPELN
jgi:hypothetical protein